MTFGKPTTTLHGKQQDVGDLERSNTATTIATLDVDAPSHPQPPLHTPQSTFDVSITGTTGSRLTDRRTFKAFKASQNLQAAALLECGFAVTALLTSPILGFLYILFIPFAIVAYTAAKSYCNGKLIMTYIVYCYVAIVARILLAIAFGIYKFYIDTILEILKTGFQFWFLFRATKFRVVAAELSVDEQQRLRGGQVAITRSETLVYV